jgi:hypothetical protein
MLLVNIITIIVIIACEFRFKHIALAVKVTTSSIYYCCLHTIRSLRTEELHHQHSLRSVMIPLILPMTCMIEIIVMMMIMMVRRSE